MIKHLSVTILYIISIYNGLQAQTVWVKIGPKISNEKSLEANDKSKQAKDLNYSYGSELTPSPRQDAVSWAYPQGGLWIYGGIGYNEKGELGIFQNLWKYNAERNTCTPIGKMFRKYTFGCIERKVLSF